MPSFTLIGSSTVARSLIAGETGFVGPNATLYVSGAPAVAMENATAISYLTVMGAVYRDGGTAILGTQVGQKRISVLGGGIVSSTGDNPIFVGAGGGALYLMNEGTLQGNLRGLGFSSTTLELLNTGSIIGITGSGILFQTSEASTVTNLGVIYGGGVGLFLAGEGTKQIYNSGTIIGLNGNAVSGGGGPVQLINEGALRGSVIFGIGNDLYDGEGGTVTGTVAGNFGNDTLRGGALAETLDGGTGDDWLYGGGGDDRLLGGAGADRVYGGAGDDTIFGGADNDHLVGNDGDDEVHGEAGADRLYGGRGDDILFGGEGQDTLYGGSGEDTLEGGAGRDELWGGTGADVFLFTNAAHSPMSAQRDVIRDFECGVDKIDLSGIFAGLTFVSSYTGVAGQVRYDAAIGRLYADLTGNRASDFSLDLTGRPAITEADLIL
ncbi:MAG: calcium-binding protein [Gemmobacter sp.]